VIVRLAPIAVSACLLGTPGPVSAQQVEILDDGFVWDLPDWLPPPPVPPDNPMSAAKVELGRHLFFDARLSVDGSTACSTCHDPALAFNDGRTFSDGVGGARGHRNAQGLANVGYSPMLTWANPVLRSLEAHALTPLFGDVPVEMGNIGQEQALFERLRADARYRDLFAEGFPERGGEVSLFTLTRALAAFQRTLVSADSPYDRYKYGGDGSALSASAKRGEGLFFSEKAECYHCHQGFNFTDTFATSRSGFDEIAFHNTGLYDVDGAGSYPAIDQGLYRFSADPRDRGRFRTPSLRNLAWGAPYFHDGSADTLDEVLDHYAAGGRLITDGPDAGDGSRNPLKNPLVLGIRFTAAERIDLLAFLDSLNDPGFVANAALADPWPEGHAASVDRRQAALGTARGAAGRTDRSALLPGLVAACLFLLSLVALLRARSAMRSNDDPLTRDSPARDSLDKHPSRS